MRFLLDEIWDLIGLVSEGFPTYFCFVVSKTKCYCCFDLGQLNVRLFRKEIFIRFTLHVFCERLSICVCASFPCGF